MYWKIKSRVIEFNVNEMKKEDFVYSREIYSNQMALMYIIVNGFFYKMRKVDFVVRKRLILNQVT